MMKLVSAICPTRGRPAYAEHVLRSFMSQSYSHRELVILDDADCPTFSSSVNKLDGVHYLRLDERLSIPAKRNLCCNLAKGQVICHFDDDDVSMPERMADQVRRLEESGKQVSGYHSLLFHDERSGRWLRYCGDSSYALGTSLCYTRDWWQSHPFRPGVEQPSVGEDNLFVKEALQAGEFVSVDGNLMMFARMHSSNTSIKNYSNPAQMSYRPVDLALIPKAFSV